MPSATGPGTYCYLCLADFRGGEEEYECFVVEEISPHSLVALPAPLLDELASWTSGRSGAGEQSTPTSDHADVGPPTIESQLPLQREHAEATGEPKHVVTTKVQSSILSFLSRR